MNCPICASTHIDSIDVPYALLRHTDFRTVKQAGCIHRCTNCQALFNDVDQHFIEQVNRLFQSSEYLLSKQTSHAVTIEKYQEPVTRSFLQADLILERFRHEKPAILDIGCFDGALLSELDRKLPFAELHGFDVNQSLQAAFPTKGNFHFWSDDLAKVPGQFDLICLSHTMSYIRDIPILMKHMQRLLKPRGVLFLQLPDISQNPCYTLMGDQYYHYTAHVLSNTFHRFGFELSLIKAAPFPREIVGMAAYVPTKTSREPQTDLRIYQCMESLDRMAAELRAMADRSVIGVLGTTANAAFVDSVLGERLRFFVDENPQRVGTPFRDKSVVHPQSLTDSDTLIIPYGQSGQKIRERFQKQYRGQCQCV